MSRTASVLLAVLIALAPPARTQAAEPQRLSFGVLNQQSPVLTAERWNPILQYLNRVTGISLQLRMGRTVEETDAMMGRGEFDFVFTNHNFQSEYDGVYRVIARWGGEPIRGVIAVSAESPLRSLKDLQGKRVAFPSADAFVAYAVPKVALLAGAIRVEEVFAGNQDGALAQLKAGQVEAAAVNSRFLEQYAKRENMPYRALYLSESYAELPVIVHPRVPKDQVEAIRRALVNMRLDPQAVPLLLKLGFPGFEAADERDYDNVRRIYRKIGQ